MIHLDQYTGEILYDAGLSDLGTLGWAAEWGVSIHMGQAWGLANQLVLLLACVAMVVMSVAAGVMWWKRRPAGSLGTPRLPADWRIPRTLLLIAVAAGIFFRLQTAWKPPQCPEAALVFFSSLGSSHSGARGGAFSQTSAAFHVFEELAL